MVDKKVTLSLDEALLPGGVAMNPLLQTGLAMTPTATLRPPTNSSNRPLTREDYMCKIRQAELVLLKEEERHGKFARDLEGRMVPLITAKTRRLVMELGKDDKRPMDEKGTTSENYAPFADASNVGLLGEEEIAEMEEKQRSEAMGNRKIKDPDFYNYDAEEEYDVLRPSDVEANPRNRGQDKVPPPSHNTPPSPSLPPRAVINPVAIPLSLPPL